jgi:hypothetical protein
LRGMQVPERHSNTYPIVFLMRFASLWSKLFLVHALAEPDPAARKIRVALRSLVHLGAEQLHHRAGPIIRLEVNVAVGGPVSARGRFRVFIGLVVAQGEGDGAARWNLCARVAVRFVNLLFSSGM